MPPADFPYGVEPDGRRRPRRPAGPGPRLPRHPKRAEEYQHEQERKDRAEAARKTQQHEEPAKGPDLDQALKGSGLTSEEYQDLKELAAKDLFDYLTENGAEILVELFAEDIKKCFDTGDIPTCIWAVIQNLGPAKAAKIASKLPKIAKAIWGIDKFLEKTAVARKKLKKFEETLEKIRKKIEKSLPDCLRDKFKDKKRGFAPKAAPPRSASGDKGKDDDCPSVAFPLFRTPKMVDKQYELANGPNPASRVEGGNDLIYFGEYSVAKEYVGSGNGSYADGMIRYDMDAAFLAKFGNTAARYDWKGPGGAPRIEFEIPYSRLKEFNSLTLKRTWMPGGVG